MRTMNVSKRESNEKRTRINGTRTSLEVGIELVMQSLKVSVPKSVRRIARETSISWHLANRAISVIQRLQDFAEAYELLVIDGPGRKILVLDLRVRMTKLPREVAGWFLDSEFFQIDKLIYKTNDVLDIVAPKEQRGRKATFEVALDRVIRALEMRDEISVRELSKRTDLNRRTIERVTSVIQQFQDELANYEVRVIESEVFMEKRPNLYDLDNARMIFLLKKRYLPKQVAEIPESKQRVLLKLQ